MERKGKEAEEAGLRQKGGKARGERKLREFFDGLGKPGCVCLRQADYDAHVRVREAITISYEFCE